MALVMYAALDIGLKEDEERTLSPGMENLLAHMISAGRHMKIKVGHVPIPKDEHN